MNNYKIIPSRLKYQSAPSIDQEIPISLEEKSQSIIEYDRNSTVNLAQVYDDERQACLIFRPTFKVTYLYANTYTGTTIYIHHFNTIFIILNLRFQSQVEHGKGYHNIMSLIFTDQT